MTRAIRACVLLSSLFLCARLLPGQEADRRVPPRALGLPEEEVSDSFLRYLLGLVAADVRFSLDAEGLYEALPEFRARRGDPFENLSEVARGRWPDGSVDLMIRFPDDLRFPIPLGILGYFPISVSVSRSVAAVERRSPSRSLGGTRGMEILSPVYEFRVIEGSVRFHFDDWLVFLTGGLLDNFAVSGISAFRYQGEWRAIIAGRGRKGQMICWFLDLKRTRFVLTVPEPLLELAGELAPPDRQAPPQGNLPP